MTRSLQGHYAGFVSRFVAFMIDAVIITFLEIGLAWFFSVAIDLLRAGPLLADIFAGRLGQIVSAILVFFLVLGYFAVFWSLTGQTPGKSLLGVRVVTVEGRRLSIWRAIFRYFCYFISSLLLFMGFAWILIDDRRQGWHDKLARTYVIYSWQARPDEKFLLDILRQYERPQQPR